ncbi:AraC family transcriptional regulator [Acidovorax sp.]|uniref:AraC family transcriptional regulator n=1 Tax=Acidovorax sp. TaxID=1872122 RepID=UPI00391BF92B
MTINMAKQTKIVDPDRMPQAVFVLSDLHAHIDGPWHRHYRVQLVHVSEGVLTVVTRSARFVIPPQRAVWIASGVEHRIEARCPFLLSTCYIEPALVAIQDASRVVAVDRLTDELLVAASQFSVGYAPDGPEARIVAVLLDRLPTLQATDISLPEPSDNRLRRITDVLLAQPATTDSLAQLAGRAAMTERTAARLFLRDTGLTFGQWRQHLRLQVALESLGAGASVTEAAFDVGYQDVSSFIAAFKMRFGTTPAKALQREAQ